jgi:hypothetical protein
LGLLTNCLLAQIIGYALVFLASKYVFDGMTRIILILEMSALAEIQ